MFTVCLTINFNDTSTTPEKYTYIKLHMISMSYTMRQDRVPEHDLAKQTPIKTIRCQLVNHWPIRLLRWGVLLPSSSTSTSKENGKLFVEPTNPEDIATEHSAALHPMKGVKRLRLASSDYKGGRSVRLPREPGFIAFSASRNGRDTIIYY